eukprot:c11078_g1_i1.p1 GENE.c11078_g1_i1~~c11078_g1_i1.p1  ORF type:complete len:193 (+),score=92.25 c11078_g1_i1:35-613(+)
MQQNLKVAVVCASNQNRSMEAHDALLKLGFDTYSYGTGSAVKLPGQTVDRPVTYKFGTPYKTMYDELKETDVDTYTQNGVLAMLERNSRVKLAPERFQDTKNVQWDLIVTFEDRVYENVVDELIMRSSKGLIQSICVVNIPTKDNREDAVVGALLCENLCLELEETPKKEDWIRVIQEFEKTHSLPILHTFY